MYVVKSATYFFYLVKVNITPIYKIEHDSI